MSNLLYHLTDLRRAEQIQILHPQFADALTRLNDFHRLGLDGAAPRHLLLVGASGAGKTSALQTFSSQHPAELVDEGRYLPIVYVRTPASPTVRGLAEAILIALGAGLQMRGSAQEKTNQVVQLLRGCRTEMLMLDEFHHFVDSGRKVFDEVTEWLKTLIDTAGIPTVLSGLPECELILRSNEQLRRRFAARVTLTPIGFSSAKEKALFRDVLHAWDTQINQGRSLWGLAEWERVRRMHYASNGLLGYVSKVVLGALELMIRTGTTEMDEHRLEQSFTRYVWADGINELNPFNTDFVFRRLDQAGEPFEPTRFTRNSPPAATA
ncbi:TniB protein [Vogesella indigofera]|uniref:TniB protein n=1 Tax=Vogesella indigofera TaxID=45465 RepID=A0A495BIA0_VOGIN|nr:TniB family NTP-binding protein [Vogesella indigofera]RKQ61080.1 TniB protein [Vogesella indigofera]